MPEALTVLGLAYRARKTVLGEEVLNRIGKVKLLFLASDISESSRKRFEKKCRYYGIEHIDVFSGEELSEALGKNNVKAVGITDAGLSETIRKKL